jgi:hypothetical protein
MKPSPKKMFLCVVGLLALCGFGGTPDCANDGIKKTVIRIVKEHPPLPLLTKAGESWSAVQKQAIEKECGKPYTEACYSPALDTLAGKQRQLDAAASYDLNNIRMTDKNETTGALSCAADLHVVLPENWGAAGKPITYLVEKASREGEFNVTVRDLQ